MANEYYVEPVVINSDDAEPAKPGSNLHESRMNAFSNLIQTESSLVTLLVYGYNRLEYTMRCVNSILKYTHNINYELLLIDNGSSDGTLEFYQSVPYKQKRIVRVTKNIGLFVPSFLTRSLISSPYVCVVMNDVIVTENWLNNMLCCISSDPSIGFVTAMSSNISNCQNPGITFDSYEEMQQKARAFNVSDSSKWQERVRLVSTLSLMRYEVYQYFCYDAGFFHDFGEDDICMRIRREGYKLMLCGDTYIHHDHQNKTYSAETQMQSLEKGRQNYKDKYYGIDGWDDINNYEFQLIGMLPSPKGKRCPDILGIDVRCGTPIVEIRNHLRRGGIRESNSFAYTTHAKYYLDLQTVAGAEHVFCDRIDFISDHLPVNSFDYIVLGEPLNSYEQPIRLLQHMSELLREGGHMLLKLTNPYDVSTFLKCYGTTSLQRNNPAMISHEEVRTCLKLLGGLRSNITAEYFSIDPETEKLLRNLLSQSGMVQNVKDRYNHLVTDKYLFCVTKGQK